MHNLDLTIADISKIEGKASCEIKIKEGKVESVKFAIAEYKRFYTQAIKDKDISALPQLAARICGTCSNAHLLCAATAIENAIGLTVSPQTVALRKLLNYGLMIRDHALHLCVFVLPDFFGKDSILEFDENDKEEHKYLDDTFMLKAAGNNLSKTVGGRSVHAPYMTVGGFTRIPSQDELYKCAEELKNIRNTVLDLIDLFATRDFTLKMEGLTYSAVCDSQYSFLQGDYCLSDGKNIPADKYGEYLDHIAIDYSQASGYKFDGRVTMVGALARVNLAKDKLHSDTKKSAEKYLSFFPSKNIFHNNLAQAIEILHAVDSAIDIIKNLKITDEKPVPVVRKEGTGIGLTEAPRGTLYYRLETDSTGKIASGQIVVPTGRNQIVIEEAIKKYLEDNIERLDNKESVEHEVEKIVRAFDPCMSCASHFLKVKWV
jgi:coenzyme F420-reducing hydrogenase alpha subunit